MPRPKTIEDRDLLEIARRVFKEQGYGATTRNVARAAGISQAVLYQRFRTKDALFFAAMHPPAPDVAMLLGEEEDVVRDGAKLHLLRLAQRLDAHVAQTVPAFLHMVTHPDFDMRSLSRAQGHPGAGQVVEALVERISALQRRHLIGPMEPRTVAETLLAAIHGAVLSEAIAGASTSSKERAEKVVEVLWQGLEPRG